MYVLHVNVYVTLFRSQFFPICTCCPIKNSVKQDKYDYFCLPGGLITSEGHDILASSKLKEFFMDVKLGQFYFNVTFFSTLHLIVVRFTLRKVGIINSILITGSMQ